MGTILASSLIAEAENALNDTENEYWTEAELLGYLNEGCRAAVLQLPEANTITATIQLVQGTKQTLPADGFRLFDIIRNMGTDGNTPGRAIRACERSALDQDTPDWHSRPANNVVRQFIHDIRNRNVFYVVPPQPENDRGRVEITYAKIPANVAIDAAIPIDDIYHPAILAFMLHRAYAKDTNATGAGLPRSDHHFQIFLTLILGRESMQELDVKTGNQIVEGDRVTLNIPGAA